MVRRVAALVVALYLVPSCLSAQSVEIRITSPSAGVYKAPSTGSPVIGTAPNGAVLPVTRDLGSWVKVVWTDAPDGIGYVHVSMGVVTRPTTSVTPSASSAAGVTQPASRRTFATRRVLSRTSVGEEVVAASEPYALPDPGYVGLPTHTLGLGGWMGNSVPAYGVTTRAWWRHLGLQVEASRGALASSIAPGRLTSEQIAPGLLYSLPDMVTPFLWLRPYVGGGAILSRETLNAATPIAGDSASDNNFGLQALGGTELTFPSVPRFALGIDFMYMRPRTPFAGFEVGGPGVAVSAHWYVK